MQTAITKFLCAIGLGTVLYGIVRLSEHEINYRKETRKEIADLRQECEDLKSELDLAQHVANDFNN